MFKKKRMRLTIIILIGLMVSAIVGSIVYKRVNTLDYKHRNDYVYLTVTDGAKFTISEDTIYIYAFDKEAKNDDEYMWLNNKKYKSLDMTVFRKDKVYTQENNYPYFLNDISKRKEIKVYQFEFVEEGGYRIIFYAVKLKDLNIKLEDFNIRITFYEKEERNR